MRKKVDFVNVWDNLTPRQKEILSFFVEGKSDKEIAKKLFLCRGRSRLTFTIF